MRSSLGCPHLDPQGHVIVKHNLLFFHLDWGWVSFFCYALKYGPFLGRFKMLYCAIILRIICSAYINHFETPTNLNHVRPALPVPRPGRDREARSLWNIIGSLYYFSAEFYLLMPYKPGLGQGHNQKKDTHPLDFDVTVPLR